MCHMYTILNRIVLPIIGLTSLVDQFFSSRGHKTLQYWFVIDQTMKFLVLIILFTIKGSELKTRWFMAEG